MFDKCQTINGGPKCTEVAEKIVQLFGWRQTYNVEKLQRNVQGRSTTRISITRPSPTRDSFGDKGPDSWVSVHNLQSQGGGILDPDDRLSDVADDREQILASFEDGEGTHLHGGGDGASGSSVGTGSPDIFHDGEHKYAPSYPRTDIEVTGEQIATGVPLLHVRRGSEPTLHQLPAAIGGGIIGPPPLTTPPNQKRWSAAPLIMEPLPLLSPPDLDGSLDNESAALGGGAGSGVFRRVARDGSSRLSMQFFGADGTGYRWVEAAERAAATRTNHLTTSLPREGRRKEPLGQANSSPSPSTYMMDGEGELIVIRNEPGPLGIHVIPDYDTLGRERGLLVKGIEPGGRIDRDGRLAIYDRVIEINGENLISMPFQRVQELFKLSLTSPELRLKLIKSSGLEGLRRPPAPIYPRFPDDKENVSMVECEQKHTTNTKVATVSPTKKVPAISKNLKGLLTANTRKIGRKIEIELMKGPHGLGFSITTRDNPAGGKCPIYIKNINAMGPAIEDGRLKIGDRLLEVNNIEMSGKTQSEAVALLKSLPLGSKVKIVVSRQEDVIENSLPRIIGIEQIDEDELLNDVPPNIPPLPQSHLQALQNRSPEKGSVAKIISRFQGEMASNHMNPSDQIDETMVFPWKHREILTFNIPVHDTEKAGLGISVKGKTSGSKDLGIFIKGVMYGGAASRDNRLRTNDQLLNVNGISLLQQSNSDAMETLKNAIPHTEGPVPGHITLTIARRVPSPANSRNSRLDGSNLSNSTNDLDDKSDSVDNSGASGGSTNTVIFNPSNNNCIEKSSPSPGQMMAMPMWNPVLDRLMGNNNKQAQLRNESYYKATHDTWSSSMLGNSSFGNTTSTILNSANAEPLLIEDEYGSRMITHPSQQQINVHITNKPSPTPPQLMNAPEKRKDHEPDGKANLSEGSSSKTNNHHQTADGSKEAASLSGCISDYKNNTDTSSQTTVQGVDATYASQLSLENPQGFTRDAFGRQSMSEKRHATLDAKNTDTYQRSKKMREERKSKDTNLVRVGSVESVISVNRSSEHPEQADKLGELGPSLGMKKSSSLESLQTMVQEIQMKEEGDPAYSYRGPSGALKVIRGRGCEESFRAAVVDPNHRTEIGAKKHWLLDGPVENEREIDGFNKVRGAPRQSSLNAALDNKNKSAKKKSGLFKGIGSMFRFGKHRKIEFQNQELPQHYHHNNEFDTNNTQQQSAATEIDNQSHKSLSDRLQEQQQQQQPSTTKQTTPMTTSGHQQTQPSAVHQHSNSSTSSSSNQLNPSQHSQSSLHSQMSQHSQQSSTHHPNQHQHHNHSSNSQQSPYQQQNSQTSSSHHQPISSSLHQQQQTNNLSQQAVLHPHQQHHHNNMSSAHQQQHRDMMIQREPIYQRHGYVHRHAEQVQVIPENSVVPSVKYRQNSSEHRRTERDLHKQRMAQRHTYYQSDDRESYDHRHQSSQRIEQQAPTQYGEFGRPGSRSGITDNVPFTHYVNYNELQTHLSRKQHQYHSQRQTKTDNQLRPVSNYYEYESVQSVLNNRTNNNNNNNNKNVQSSSSNSAQHGYQDVNITSNNSSLHRNQAIPSRNAAMRSSSNTSNQPHGGSSTTRGPFVTQVTIGEHHQQNGTKV